MKHTPLSCIMVVMLAGMWLSACSKSRDLSVWETYDVRYPVPAASQVPVSRATVYNRYVTDNDSFYTKPQFGSCSASDLDEFSCD